MGDQANGAEALLELCRVQGVDCIFCSPIAVWAPLWEALAKRAATSNIQEPRYFNCRHELLAVGLASGYFKASGRPQVVLLPTGLGVLSGSMAVRSALQERVPMLIVSPDTLTYGADPELDPGPEWPSLLVDLPGPSRHSEAFVKWTREVKTPADLVSEVRRAFHFADSVPRGPTLLSVPFDILMRRVPPTPEKRIEPCDVVAADDVVEGVADLLMRAENPLIVTEHAGQRREIVETLVGIAERVGAPVFEFMMPLYHNFPRDHPLHGLEPVESHLKDADCVLIAGGNGPWHPPTLEIAEGGSVIHMDEDPLRPRAPYWGYQTDYCVAGDLGANLARCLAALGARGRSPDEEKRVAARTARWTVHHQSVRDRWRAADDHVEGISGRALFAALNQALPRASVVVDEMVAETIPMLQYLFDGRAFEHIRGWQGALGTGLATALGVKLAKPDHLVVCVIGDGAFHYNPIAAAFGLAQQYAVPILVIVCDNGGFRSQEWNIQKYFGDGYAVRTDNPYGRVIDPTPDYAMLAAAYGGAGERVEERDQLGPTIERAMRATEEGRFALVHAVIAE